MVLSQWTCNTWCVSSLLSPCPQASPPSRQVLSHLIYFFKNGDDEIQIKTVKGLGEYHNFQWFCHSLSGYGDHNNTRTRSMKIMFGASRDMYRYLPVTEKLREHAADNASQRFM